MAKGDVLVRMRADVSNYDANIAKARKTLDGFRQDNLTLGGIMNQTSKSIVAAAAQYASFAAVLGTVASGFSEAISKGIEMSSEAEGVSKAFNRLNQPGLLDNLRQATHGTINDLELMKQAVKFDNFNLSLEQMGTFLSFAQQQAKDTGQDVNYLVDSIVTGLGRKSLPILDNLGLSATEIRERMKETGDMTQAVADIIKDRMEAAGGYVETAADRAAQAQAKLDNAMKELGDTMQSLSGAGATLWTDLKIGAIDLANNAIKPLIKLFSELATYIEGTSVESILTKGMTELGSNVDDKGNYIRRPAQKGAAGFDWDKGTWKEGYYGAIYDGSTGQTIFPDISITGTRREKKTPKTTTTKTSSLNIAFDPNRAALAGEQGVDTMPSVWAMIGEQGRKQLIGGSAKQFDLGRDISKKGTTNLDEKKNDANLQDITSNVGSMLSSLENIGIEIPKGFAQVFGVLQTITTIVAGIQALQQVGTFLGLFANGGVAHAANGLVPGRSFSGDRVPALLNSGETVLTRAQSSNLVSMLNNNGMGTLQMETYLSGEDIRFVINNNGRRTGVGEMVTSKVRRI